MKSKKVAKKLGLKTLKSGVSLGRRPTTSELYGK